MRSTIVHVLLLSILGFAAQAQPGQVTFPIDQRFTLDTLNGKPVAERVTLTIALAGNRKNHFANGVAGCNGWFGEINALGPGELRFGTIAMTSIERCQADTIKKFEAGFESALEQVTRWRFEGGTLILEGAGNSLGFTASAR